MPQVLGVGWWIKDRFIDALVYREVLNWDDNCLAIERVLDS